MSTNSPNRGLGPSVVGIGLAVAAVIGLGQPAFAASELPLSDFVVEAAGSFESWIDSRNLLVMHHPWAPSATGGYLSATISRKIPPNLKPPLRLAFYVSDDYFNDFWRAENDSWLGGDGFYGHRFKQVWVNDDLLWESDVADANPPNASGSVVLDLPGIEPGSKVEISLKLVDRVSSWIELASDTQHISTTETGAEKPGDPAKYTTHVYWGDVSILSGGEEPPAPTLHLSDRVEENHRKRWPLPPYGDPGTSLPFEYILRTTAPIPGCGFPVRCGIPLPAGLVQSPTSITLYNPSGMPIGSDLRATSHWKDGSVRWITATFIAAPGDEDGVFRVERSSSSQILPSTTIQGVSPPFRIRSEWAEIALQDGRTFPALVRDRTEDRSFLSTTETSGVHSATAGATPICRFDNRTSVLGALPILASEYRLFFDRQFPAPFEELRLGTSVPFSEVTGIIHPTGHEFTSAQIESSTIGHTFSLDDRRRVWVNGQVIEEGTVDSLWLAVTGVERTNLYGLRHGSKTGQAGFRVVRNGEDLFIQCLPFTNRHSQRGYPFTPGEAKTFQTLHASLPPEATREEFSRIAESFERPPILVNPDLLCRSGAFGLAQTAEENPSKALAEFLKKQYPDPLTKLQWGKSPRDFGDTIYNASNSWRNGYYDVRQGFVAAYLLTGNRDWADALDRAVQHYVDVDVIHSSTEHPHWVGLPHGYGENHTSMDPWNPITRLNGVLAGAQIWGNERFYDAAIRMAEAIVRTKRGIGAGSVRDHAGIMMSLATAYRETRDPRIGEAADRLVQDILENRVEPRRGTYPEVHGNWNYRGNVPWMVAQLIEPLYLYYRESGNLDAAKLLVGMVESILCENQERGVPGDIYGYSHNPHFNKTSGYHVLIAPCLFYAHELTGDESFLRAGWAAWEQTVREETFNDVQNCFWNTPTLSYYLRETREPRRE